MFFTRAALEPVHNNSCVSLPKKKWTYSYPDLHCCVTTENKLTFLMFWMTANSVIQRVFFLNVKLLSWCDAPHFYGIWTPWVRWIHSTFWHLVSLWYISYNYSDLPSSCFFWNLHLKLWCIFLFFPSIMHVCPSHLNCHNNIMWKVHWIFTLWTITEFGVWHPVVFKYHVDNYTDFFVQHDR